MNAIHLKIAAIAAASACLAPIAARGDDRASLADLVKAGTVDMPLATSPATFMLGASGENVPRLTSFRAFSMQAARAFDESGHVANAVAVELAPALAMGRMTWSDITSTQLNRIWSRTTVSFATKPKDGDAPARSAIGLQSVLWAPAMDKALSTVATDDTCTRSMFPHDEAGPGPNLSHNPARTSDGTAASDACQAIIDGVLTKWNQPMVAIGLGHAFVNPQGEATPAKPSTAFWLTAAYGEDIGKTPAGAPPYGWLVTAHTRQSTNVPSAADDGTSTWAREHLAGVNGRFGTRKLAGIAEFSVTRETAHGFKFADRRRAVLGLQYQLASDMYLTAGVARDTGASKARQSMLAGLSWGFSQQPVLAPQ